MIAFLGLSSLSFLRQAVIGSAYEKEFDRIGELWDSCHCAKSLETCVVEGFDPFTFVANAPKRTTDGLFNATTREAKGCQVSSGRPVKQVLPNLFQ